MSMNVPVVVKETYSAVPWDFHVPTLKGAIFVAVVMDMPWTVVSVLVSETTQLSVETSIISVRYSPVKSINSSLIESLVIANKIYSMVMCLFLYLCVWAYALM